MRVLGVDLGSRRIGLAISDSDGTFAFPLDALESRGLARDVEALRVLIGEREVEQVVVGLPLHMSGRAGPEAESARRFARSLSEIAAVPVDLLDERWTTAEAERALLAGPGGGQAPRGAQERRARLDGRLDPAADVARAGGRPRTAGVARGGSPVKRWLVAAAIATTLGATALAALAFVLHQRLEPVRTGDTDPIDFRVERGRSLRQVASGLEGAGLVRDARAVVWLARWRGWESALKAGEYELSPAWSPERILEQIIAGRVRTYTTVLPEGIRASEIAARLDEAGLARRDDFLRVVRDPAFAESLGVPAPTLEGYLYPETYELPRDLPPEELARILVEQFNAAWRQIEPEARDLQLSKHQIVTLASIVEKETATPEERPLIAAVFLNRLHRGMRLETDPTVIYGIENFDGNLRKRDLMDKSNPYNTYQIAGLPPGPIANPGIDSLRAVVEPAQTDYLYFVSRNDGTHEFSRTYREHVNAVNRYQKRRSASR